MQKLTWWSIVPTLIGAWGCNLILGNEPPGPMPADSPEGVKAGNSSTIVAGAGSGGASGGSADGGGANGGGANGGSPNAGGTTDPGNPKLAECAGQPEKSWVCAAS